MKKILTLFMAMVMLFSMSSVSFAASAATVEPLESTSTENERSVAATLFYDSGLFTTYYHNTFSVSTTGYTTFIYAVNGTNGNTNPVTVVVNNTDTDVTYVNDTFTPSSSARVAHATIPAGNYEVYIYGYGQYAYVLNFYR